MWAFGSKAVSTVQMIAVVAHSLGIMLKVTMWASRNLLSCPSPFEVVDALLWQGTLILFRLVLRYGGLNVRDSNLLFLILSRTFSNTLGLFRFSAVKYNVFLQLCEVIYESVIVFLFSFGRDLAFFRNLPLFLTLQKERRVVLFIDNDFKRWLFFFINQRILNNGLILAYSILSRFQYLGNLINLEDLLGL